MAEFYDRLEAGERLAEPFRSYQNSDAVVLGMARGGVVVGYSVARSLGLPLEALIVRKLGAPGNPELAIGAVSETGVVWLDPGIVAATGASEEYIRRVTEEEVGEARRRQREYRRAEESVPVSGHHAIVVDDGIATGASALVAVETARELGATRVILASPVASRQAVSYLSDHADEVVVLAQPEPFLAVGLYYDHFDQVTDQEVVDYLQLAKEAVQ